MCDELSQTLRKLREECLEWLHCSGYRPRTTKSYRLALQEFGRWCARQKELKELSDLTLSTLQGYQVHLSLRGSKKTKKGEVQMLLGPSAKIVHISALKKFFEYLKKHNYLLTNPSVELESPRSKRGLPRTILSVSEMFQLLAQFQGEDPLALRDRAVFEVLYSSGIRRAELEGLKVDSVLFQDKTLRVEGKGGKERLVPLGQEALKALEAYLKRGRPRLHANGSQALFLSSRRGRLRAHAVLSSLRKAAARAGITRPIDLHCIRHTCATHMLKNGADIRYIQQLLGHSSLTTTQVYTRVENTDLRRMLDECHPRERF